MTARTDVRLTTVCGEVVAAGDVPGLLPPNPQGGEVPRPELLVLMSGDSLPPHGCYASVTGELVGNRLMVTSWIQHSAVPGTPSAVPDSVGIPTEDSYQYQISLTIPDDWDLISFSGWSVGDGRDLAIVEVVRAESAVADWVSRQPKNAVCVFPFIRDADAPAVLQS
ncbi:MAG: hypothetical protein QM711_16570 [Micropruina sp.]|uniref:hypothetical protein n=1 Tax=Micropruina sp. TaxID=2737536 RepID=UPI0039E2809A